MKKLHVFIKLSLEDNTRSAHPIAHVYTAFITETDFILLNSRFTQHTDKVPFLQFTLNVYFLVSTCSKSLQHSVKFQMRNFHVQQLHLFSLKGMVDSYYITNYLVKN